MRTEGRGDDVFVLQEDTRAGFEIGVALRLLLPHGHAPAVLCGLDPLVIPIGPFDQAHGETRAAPAAPLDQVAQVALGVAQVGLDDDAGMRPIAELRLGEERFEKLERAVFMRVALHVEIDEGAQLPGAADDRPQLRREVRDRVRRVGRVHLRVERGNFNRHIHYREKLAVAAQRIGPAARFRGQALEQRQATLAVFVGFLLAHDRFA